MPQTATPRQVPATCRQPGPAPAWERHQLFQEPAYPEGLALFEDDADEDEDEDDI